MTSSKRVRTTVSKTKKVSFVLKVFFSSDFCTLIFRCLDLIQNIKLVPKLSKYHNKYIKNPSQKKLLVKLISKYYNTDLISLYEEKTKKYKPLKQISKL